MNNNVSSSYMICTGLVSGEEWFSLDASTLTLEHGSLDTSELILELDDFLQGMRN